VRATWEYKVIWVSGYGVSWDESIKRRETVLNQLGADGWELVGAQGVPGQVESIAFVLKRPKSTGAPPPLPVGH
jgi:hypothetical protein